MTTIDIVLTAGERSIVSRASLGPPRDGVDFCDVGMPDVPGPEGLPSEQWPEDNESSVHVRYDMRFAKVAPMSTTIDEPKPSVGFVPMTRPSTTSSLPPWPIPGRRRWPGGSEAGLGRQRWT